MERITGRSTVTYKYNDDYYIDLIRYDENFEIYLYRKGADFKKLIFSGNKTEYSQKEILGHCEKMMELAIDEYESALEGFENAEEFMNRTLDVETIYRENREEFDEIVEEYLSNSPVRTMIAGIREEDDLMFIEGNAYRMDDESMMIFLKMLKFEEQEDSLKLVAGTRISREALEEDSLSWIESAVLQIITMLYRVGVQEGNEVLRDRMNGISAAEFEAIMGDVLDDYDEIIDAENFVFGDLPVDNVLPIRMRME